MTLLHITFELGDGATDGNMKIDRRAVKITQGAGVFNADDKKNEHRVAMVFSGPPGSSLSYEIKQGPTSLVKGKMTVNFGQAEGALAGPFKLRSNS